MKFIHWRYLGFFALLLISSTAINAQKIGYLDVELLLADLPEVKEIDSKLEGVRAEYWNKGQEMVAVYQQKLIKLQNKASDCFPKNLEIEAEKLKQEQLKIENFEKEMNTVLNQKTQDLMNPIRTKLSKCITEVAKENGYTYIFNVSFATFTIPNLSYYEEEGDVSKLVLEKYNNN